ncbi:S41 family peptidase [Xanthovirga aplysinae]|uniref:S41 family peptidase n=1 Tax=Xanthovirga aplysinae TaxID=2529853 RepID=UPI0012BC5791|nr:S41 family peptidase [Xanthovirga aplysinae]MTI31327.1 S41 family peptidase [Xanthovirga aplysinae]
MKKNKFRLSVVGSLLIAILCLSAYTGSERYFQIAKNLDIFATLFREVNTYYVDEVNPNHLVKSGIDAMLESLDPYTNYIPEDEIEDYRTMTTGQYGGIGALIGKRKGKTTVLMPYEGYPAHKAGLKIGDEIISINGVELEGKSTSEVSKLLKGQSDTDLVLMIERFGENQPLEIKLNREKITIDNVPYYGMISEEVGYIKLTDFTSSASREVKNALIELKAKGAKKLILDLRGNPGGLLSEAVNVSNLFIPKGAEVVSTKGKVKDWNKTYRALNSPVDMQIPLVILTNGRSASAAEIVSGVMQDYDRGVLVGQKTFGKGLVQATRPLSYNSQLKVTTAKYYTPSGRCIQAIDYTHRHDDGTVDKVPDSLKTAFSTSKGRVVYDGGGIDPDIITDKKELPPIAASLVSKGLIFDYATQYYYRHKKISTPKDFSLSNSDYKEFKEWLSDKDYDYTTKVEKTINDLIESAKTEQYFDDIEEQILALERKVHHNKESDLVKFREQVQEILEEEIVARYFLQKGLIEASFKYDIEIREALKLLEDDSRYRKVLQNN